jgi:hypothetical protein
MNKWSWPFPGYTPWEPLKDIPVTFCYPQKMCAVEKGTVKAIFPLGNGLSLWDVYVEGASGIVAYMGISIPGDTLKVGSAVRRGSKIGVSGIGPTAIFLWPEIPTDLSKRIDCVPLLRAAWSHVTPRFHRDAPAIPIDPLIRRDTVLALHDHPLWHYPISIRNPPEGYEWKSGDFFEVRNTWPEVMEDLGGDLGECIDISHVYVDPTLERIVGKLGWHGMHPRNTAFRVWIEGGGWYDMSKQPEFNEPEGGWTEFNQWGHCHDPNLDCGAPDLETALLNLSIRTYWYYGSSGKEYRMDVPKQCEGTLDGHDQYHTGCVDAGDGFCKVCGYLVSEYWTDDDEDAAEDPPKS